MTIVRQSDQRDATRSQSALPGTAPASPARPAPQRFEELDAYRGLAALLIVVFHAYQYSREATNQATYVYEGTPLHYLFGNLDVGVAWFFVLSGFLLFLPIARSAIRQTPVQSARWFLIKRAIRILPLYYVAILIVWTFRYTGGWEQWRDLLQHLTFTHTFDRVHIFWTIGPAWSLGVEVHFYIALALLGPFLHRICGRLSTERARIWLLVASVGLIGGMGVAYKWWAAFVADIPESNSVAYFNLPAKLDDFAIGMMLGVGAAAMNGRRVLGPRGAAALRLVSVALLILVFSMRYVESIPHALTVQDVYVHPLSALGFGLLLAAAVFGPQTSRWGQALTHPVFRHVGLVSYSVYLWHEPILIELGRRGWLLNSAPEAFPLNAAILVALSLAIGTLTYFIVELPTLELRHLFTADRRPAPSRYS